MIDPSAIGRVSMSLMEHLAEQYGEDTELVRVFVAVEVRYPVEDEEGQERLRTDVAYEYDDDSLIPVVGLLYSTLHRMLS